MAVSEGCGYPLKELKNGPTKSSVPHDHNWGRSKAQTGYPTRSLPWCQVSGRAGSNRRPPRPKRGALPLRYAPCSRVYLLHGRPVRRATYLQHEFAKAACQLGDPMTQSRTKGPQAGPTCGLMSRL